MGSRRRGAGLLGVVLAAGLAGTPAGARVRDVADVSWPTERFADVGPTALAELILGPAPGFPVAHAATAMGLPLFATRDPEAALAHRMVVLQGELDGRTLSAALERRLEAYVEAGGTLVVDDLAARVARNLAGVVRATPSGRRTAVTFADPAADPGLARLTAPEARTIVIGNRRTGNADPSEGLDPVASASVTVLARFDDGAPALVRRTAGKGRVYALGVRLLDLVLRPQCNRDPDVQRWYDNHFEPSADVPQVLLRDWYLAWVPGAIALDPVPDGRDGALLLTHDIDYRRSVENMPAYARAERARGVRATYFFQTKVVKDYEDRAFFDARAAEVIRQVAAQGAEIQSHTVSHAYDWRRFPLGDPAVDPARYRPRVRSKVTGTRGGTVYGEVRASRALLRGVLPGAPIDAFRTGYLQINPMQWTALERSGYRYDSSYSADDVLTAFPYTATERAGYEQESRVIEFPILLTDSHMPMRPLVPAFDRVLDAEAVFHGVCVVLIHPDVVKDKLPTELALLDHVRDRFWVAPLGEFGRFWEARAGTRLDVAASGSVQVVTVRVPAPVSGLTLDLPHAAVLEAVEGATAHATPDGRRIVLGAATPGRPVVLTLAPGR